MFRAGGNYDAYTNPQSSFGRGRNPRRRQDLPPLLGVSGGQFGQIGIGQVSGPSLEEMLSQRGFKMPEKPTGAESQIALMYKDPITGKMQSGGPHAASHAKAMSDFYGQNPEALDIAKQHQQDQQYNPGGGRDLFNASPLGPPQEIRPSGMQSQPMQQPISLGNQLPQMLSQPIQDRRARMDIHLAPPTRPSMGNPSGSLGGQITHDGPGSMGSVFKPNPYSAPPQIGGGFGGQMGGGMGGGQGMGQFMQFMQTMMQMFQQFQGGGGRGMGGGFGGPSPFMPQQQQYGQRQPQPAQLRAHQSLQPRRMSNQFNPNNAFGGY